MNILGYDNERHPVCNALMPSFQDEKARIKNQDVSADHLNYLDNLLQQCANIVIAHISSMPSGNRQVIYDSFKSAFNKLLKYFHRWDSHGNHQRWVDEWTRVLKDFDSHGNDREQGA
jgi:hypothetical protein